MRRGRIAEWGVLLSLLAAQAGCSWVGVRRWSNERKPTSDETSQAQHVIEHAQEAIDRGDLETARAELLQQVARTPGSAEAQQRLGSVYQLQGRLAEAKACFGMALKLDPDYVDALIGLGQVETQEGETESALKRFETAIEIDPHRTQAHFSLGNLLQVVGRTDAALAAYFRALEGEPNNAAASRCIAALQLARNQPDQALSRLDRVLELAPDDGEARFFHGQAHMALGHIPQALADFRDAAGRLPDRPDIHYHMALALEADHKPAEARRAAEQALRLAPDFVDAQKLSNRLARAVASAGTTKSAPRTRPLENVEKEGPADPPR
jgi:tetratricopeptide (TPR) repeat protein